MFYWAWRIIKRRPTRYLLIGGPAMLLAALIHLKLMGSLETAHPSIRESGLGALMVCGDGVLAIGGWLMASWGMWRVAHRRP